MKTSFLPHLKNETTAVETRHATSLQTSLPNSKNEVMRLMMVGNAPATAIVLLEKLGGNEVSNPKKFVKISEIRGQKNSPKTCK